MGLKLFLIGAIVFLSFMLWIHNNSSKNNSWKTEKQNTSEKEQSDTKKRKEEDKNEKKEETVTVTRQDGTVVKLPLETYLEGVIGSEMPASFEMEALKAQCVAARTFVTKRKFSVDDTTNTQVYHDDKQMRQIWGDNYDTNHARVVKALKETKGEILTYKGEVISAVFFSGSCGKTANSEEYWNNKTPYLRSVDSHWDKKEKGYEQQITMSENAFASALGFENKVTQVGTPQYYASGYVKSITIDHMKFSGRKMRELLGLRSSSFQITKKKDSYVITTKGYGHGLGLSQYGAQGMASEGASYKEILFHYYTGVKIES